MSRTSNTNLSVNDLHNDRITVYVRQCLPSLNEFDRVPSWARHYAREYFHTVCKQPGFLPVYHALWRAGSVVQTPAPTPAATPTHARITRQNALPSASTRLTRDEIFAASWPSVSNFTDVNAWARAHARNYYHQLNGTRTFLSIYKDLLEDAEDQEDTLSYTSSEADDTTFATDGRPTRAESDEGQRQLNAICFREYRRWYDAFEAEAHEGDGDMSADERFALHVGRILRTKTGLPAAQCATVVNGWLHLHKEHLE